MNAVSGCVRSPPQSRPRWPHGIGPLSAMCGRLRVGKENLHVAGLSRCGHVFGLFVCLHLRFDFVGQSRKFPIGTPFGNPTGRLAEPVTSHARLLPDTRWVLCSLGGIEGGDRDTSPLEGNALGVVRRPGRCPVVPVSRRRQRRSRRGSAHGAENPASTTLRYVLRERTRFAYDSGNCFLT